MKIIFLTIAEPGYSRSWVYYDILSRNGHNVEFKKISKDNFFKSLRSLRRKRSFDCLYIVMSPSHYLTILVRIFLGKKIILDAGWSLFESTILSRNQYGILGFKIIKLYLIDWMSAHLAKIVLVESYAQKNFYSKLFLVRSKKIHCIYTGLDELQYNSKPKLINPPVYFKNSAVVLFRGKYTKEAGIEILEECTFLLEKFPITFWVYSPELPKKFVFSGNTYVNRGYLDSKAEIYTLYDKCTIALGQLSAHSRLGRTIPHKAFEAAFAAKPYVTARSTGISEVFCESYEMICFEPGNAVDLSSKLNQLINDKVKLNQLSQNIKEKYNSEFSSPILYKKLLKIISTFPKS